MNIKCIFGSRKLHYYLMYIFCSSSPNGSADPNEREPINDLCKGEQAESEEKPTKSSNGRQEVNPRLFWVSFVFCELNLSIMKALNWHINSTYCIRITKENIDNSEVFSKCIVLSRSSLKVDILTHSVLLICVSVTLTL